MVAPCEWGLTPGACCEEWSGLNATIKQRSIRLAERFMWAATGRRYGECEWTVQPCAARPLPPLYQVYPEPFGRGAQGGWNFYPYIQDGQWFNPGAGACNCCDRACELILQGPTRTEAIVSVSEGGVILPTTSYVVFNGSILTRTDGECWPSCVNFGDQDPPDFEIVYRRGLPVPGAVLDAASVLACEFGRACAGGPCRLPQRLRRLTRQGVEVETAEVDRARPILLTGIEEVDMVIQAENPHALQARARVFNPDRRRPRRVT